MVKAPSLLPVLVCVLAGCGSSLLGNSRFNFWDGNNLLTWNTIRGSVRPAETWHPKDLGVELLGNDTAISQRAERYPECILINLLAQSEETTTLQFEVDFYDDGVVDARQQIPVSNWAPLRFYLFTTATFDREPVRFTVSKRGDGRAVLANLSVEGEEYCPGEVLVPAGIPLGRACDRDAVCASEKCSQARFDQYGTPLPRSCE